MPEILKTLLSMKAKTYIQLVAENLIKRFGRDMTKVAVVFPNKRAALFLNQELVKAAAKEYGGQEETVIWSPTYITISDLFRNHSSLHVADQILLVCRLYEVFQRITGNASETLDQFYNWGVLLLSDFDDIDKNMADARKVFQLLSDLHELDDISYLEDSQREALKQFFSSFNGENPSMMKEKFLRMWSKLFDIYTAFRSSLAANGLAYEGMLYREVAENSGIEYDFDTYCFIGFNMLQVVEQKLFLHMKNLEPKGGQPRALFFWDYDKYYMNRSHEAGHFIGEYLSMFPDALDGVDKENLISTKKESGITFVSATTENLQARYVHDWLLENERYKAGARTAIVMSDEKLLMTIIRSLPEEVEKVNVTTGFPLSQATVVSLLQHLIELQTAGKISGTDKFLMRYVNRVLCHPYAHILSPLASELQQKISKEKIFFPSEDFLCPDEGLKIIFEDIDQIGYKGNRAVSMNIKLTLWLQNILQKIAKTDNSLPALDKESIFRTHQILQRLLSLSIDGFLAVDISTFRRLIKQIIGSTTVPYHGEPIEGIQIMGVLETRCLDFDHILLLSCNEGNMPKGVDDSSFIPHSVRKAHGLTTVENKVGIYSYYFHRLLQRSSDVTITYNSSTEGINTGEMSRFMLQIMAESGISIQQRSISTTQSTKIATLRNIQKDSNVMSIMYKKLEEGTISPTELVTYLRCQQKYYYQYVLGIKTDNDLEPDEMDNIYFGRVFHEAAKRLYNKICDCSGVIHAEAIDNVKKGNQLLIERCIDEAFRKEVFNITDESANYKPQYTGLQLINRRVLIRLLNDLLDYDRHFTPISILGLEDSAKVYGKIPMEINGTMRTVNIGGIIDRLDMINIGNGKKVIRVVDYKTGHSLPGKITTVSDVFLHDKIEKHSDYYLQTMMYSILIKHSKKLNPNQEQVATALFYVQKIRQADYSPYLQIDGEDIMNISLHEQNFLLELRTLIAEIFNPEIPFAPNGAARSCELCDFRNLCGK